MKNKNISFFLVVALLSYSQTKTMMTVAQKTVAAARVAGRIGHIPTASIVQRATIVNSLYESQRAFGILSHPSEKRKIAGTDSLTQDRSLMYQPMVHQTRELRVLIRNIELLFKVAVFVARVAKEYKAYQAYKERTGNTDNTFKGSRQSGRQAGNAEDVYSRAQYEDVLRDFRQKTTTHKRDIVGGKEELLEALQQVNYQRPVHEILGIDKGASEKETRVAYIQWVRCHHPDRYRDEALSKKATTVLQYLNKDR